VVHRLYNFFNATIVAHAQSKNQNELKTNFNNKTCPAIKGEG